MKLKNGQRDYLDSFDDPVLYLRTFPNPDVKVELDQVAKSLLAVIHFQK